MTTALTTRPARRVWARAALIAITAITVTAAVLLTTHAFTDSGATVHTTPVSIHRPAPGDGLPCDTRQAC